MLEIPTSSNHNIPNHGSVVSLVQFHDPLLKWVKMWRPSAWQISWTIFRLQNTFSVNWFTSRIHHRYSDLRDDAWRNEKFRNKNSATSEYLSSSHVLFTPFRTFTCTSPYSTFPALWLFLLLLVFSSDSEAPSLSWRGLLVLMCPYFAPPTGLVFIPISSTPSILLG